jgi:hypothetical protein
MTYEDIGGHAVTDRMLLVSPPKKQKTRLSRNRDGLDKR